MEWAALSGLGTWPLMNDTCKAKGATAATSANRMLQRPQWVKTSVCKGQRLVYCLAQRSEQSVNIETAHCQTLTDKRQVLGAAVPAYRSALKRRQRAQPALDFRLSHHAIHPQSPVYLRRPVAW